MIKLCGTNVKLGECSCAFYVIMDSLTFMENTKFTKEDGPCVRGARLVFLNTQNSLDLSSSVHTLVVI